MGIATKTARENKNKTTFVLDASRLQALSGLTLEQKGEFLEYLMNFVLHDKEPNVQSAPGAMAIMEIQNIERDNQKWLETCKKNKEAQHKRWRLEYEKQKQNQPPETETPFT